MTDLAGLEALSLSLEILIAFVNEGEGKLWGGAVLLVQCGLCVDKVLEHVIDLDKVVKVIEHLHPALQHERHVQPG